MPTPSDNILHQHSAVDHLQYDRLTHTTCPPDSERVDAWRSNDGTRDGELMGHNNDEPPPQQQAEPTADVVTSGPMGAIDDQQEGNTKMVDIEQEQSSTDGMSPMSVTAEVKEGEPRLSPAPIATAVATTSSYSSMSHEFSNVRLYPNHTSSFLRAGSKFRGTQKSDHQVYTVEVDIKHVDMNESFLCGYLRIEGLTEDHPTLTTYFEGEIIGPKYTFQTKHESWGATDKTDMHHWYRFPAWRPLAKQAKKPDFHYKNGAQKENIFMRWKEYFLVPDHRVREIMGASFEGFYYICFNQVAGTVSGIYFHAKSEK
ncbi:Vacuolar import/degradation protein Vid24 [Lasallia pustulata]|uniref:Vacuolar import/degradation protein Vid24 n=1 Tax=Lasallia pustulata TaxID=136370 RepID=A0A1W5D3W9_9LECA|nr:Vacuolar import/degradation protein Vid24 [Lasallia pustulata]